MKLVHINNVLLALIILVNGYVIAAPFLPAIVFHFESHSGRRQELQAAIQPPSKTKPPVATHQPNHLIVPAMLLDQPVLEGPVSRTYKTLDQGIWRWPNGSTPDKGGNTVFIGHRFTYTNPKGVFYYLDKVSLGDSIGVFWNDQQYNYRVTDIRVVVPSDTSIEDVSNQSKLTLFTCTPLWLPKNRLVVVASLERP